MFTRIAFYCDENGNPLEKTRIIHASDVNSSSFELQTDDKNHIQIRRNYMEVENDPYNDDGNPPTVMLSIMNATVVFYGGFVEITGFEQPNLCIGGLIVEPYNNKIRPIARIVSNNRYTDLTKMKYIRPQKILLFR